MAEFTGIVVEAVKPERRKHHRDGGLVIEKGGVRMTVSMPYIEALKIAAKFKGTSVVVNKHSITITDTRGRVIYKR